MVKPTRCLLDELDRYGLKLTIMADAAEILRFKDHAEQTGHDRFHYLEIAEQLRDAIRRGHDVQLHLHPSFFNARLMGDTWAQDWSEYNYADLPLEPAQGYVRRGKEFLEALLAPTKPDYACIAFRAANWAMQPSKTAIAALVANGMKIDTSVFRYGKRTGRVRFDYTAAPVGLMPWRADPGDICRPHPEGVIWEVPIYSELRTIHRFLTFARIRRLVQGRFRGAESNPTPGVIPAGRGGFSMKPKTYAWKADFNQCTSGQLIQALKRAEQSCLGVNWGTFVMIGHSKLYDSFNQKGLRGFLEFCASDPKRFKPITITGALAFLGDPKEKTRVETSKPGFAYVLVTPARDEENTIGETIASVVNQTVLPREWIIVSDGSSDGTDRIVTKHAKTHSFIRLLRLEDRAKRSFSSVVFATEAGVKGLQFRDFQYLGLLDADVRFPPNYFETLMCRMAARPDLGLVGGLALDVVAGHSLWHQQNLAEVAGAVQFYSRACWESLGPLVAIPEGGWDAITSLQARTNGYTTLTFEDINVEHLKPRNAADGGTLLRAWNLGLREYALGYHPFFETLKCLSRIIEPPVLIGSVLRWFAFLWCWVTRRKRVLPQSLVFQIRKEQCQRLSLGFLPRAGLRIQKGPSRQPLTK
jgi:glycosyltransferase involved in cell wall biosynthesis